VNRLLLGNTTDLFADISLTSEQVYGNSSHALLTLKGYKGAPNQDRALIVKWSVGNNVTISEPEDMQSKEALLMGIFDGHGERGHDVSQHVALELPKTFARLMKQNRHVDANYDDWLRSVLITTFIEVDNHEPVKGSGASGGSTASTLFYPGSGSKIYLANVGDSTTIIAHYNKSSRQATIVKQNRKDKPHVEEERTRIEAAGGQVYIPFHHPSNTYGPKDSSRLLITLPGGFQLGLAMSRSIGDAEGKPFGLISEPTVEVFDINQYYLEMRYSEDQINDTEWFLIAASDGVFDVIPHDEVVQRLGESLYIAFDVQRTCERLIREASRLWIKATMQQPYRDDITLGVSKIQLQY
jgi:serine/threonine protein phosphatase PrpC